MITRFFSGVLMAIMLTTPVSAAERFDARAPVSVAFTLYKDCLRTKLDLIGDDDLPEPKSIGEIVNYSDDWCIAWTVIWYPALMGHPIDTWTPDKLDRFTKLRFATMQSMGRGLAEIYNSKRTKSQGSAPKR